jgi:hypothetical protein
VDPTRGYIALSDPDWYDYLRRQPHLDEVNFWQPHGNAFRALKPGETFFFKLRAPHKAIAGFGFFERWESMPASYAWDCFAEANSAPTFAAMLDRITRLRRDPSPAADGTTAGRTAGTSISASGFRVQCIMMAASTKVCADCRSSWLCECNRSRGRVPRTRGVG